MPKKRAKTMRLKTAAPKRTAKRPAACRPAKSDKTSPALTAKHILFIAEYLRHGVAWRAYKDVYNCTDAAARSSASALLTNPNIRSEVDRRQQEIMKQAQRQAAQIVLELKGVATEARAAAEYSAAVSANMGQAKILGVIRDKVDATIDGNLAITWEEPAQDPNKPEAQK